MGARLQGEAQVAWRNTLERETWSRLLAAGEEREIRARIAAGTRGRTSTSGALRRDDAARSAGGRARRPLRCATPRPNAATYCTFRPLRTTRSWRPWRASSVPAERRDEEQGQSP